MSDDSLIESPLVTTDAGITVAEADMAASPTPATPETPAQVVYVGPRLLRPFPVGTRTIFRGPLPAPLAKAVADNADLAALFVPVAEIGQALRTVATPGTALARAAAAVAAQYLRKEA